MSGSKPKAARTIKFQQQNKESKLFNKGNKYKEANWTIQEGERQILLFKDPSWNLEIVQGTKKTKPALVANRLSSKLTRKRYIDKSFIPIDIKIQVDVLNVIISWPSDTLLDSKEMQDFSKILFDNNPNFLSTLCSKLSEKAEAPDESDGAGGGGSGGEPEMEGGGGSAGAGGHGGGSGGKSEPKPLSTRKRGRSRSGPVVDEHSANRQALGWPLDDTPASSLAGLPGPGLPGPGFLAPMNFFPYGSPVYAAPSLGFPPPMNFFPYGSPVYAAPMYAAPMYAPPMYVPVYGAPVYASAGLGFEDGVAFQLLAEVASHRAPAPGLSAGAGGGGSTATAFAPVAAPAARGELDITSPEEADETEAYLAGL